MARARILLLGLLVLVSACGDDDGSPPAAPAGVVDVSGDPVRLNGGAITAEFSRQPYRLTVRSAGTLLTREESGGAFFEVGGVVHRLERVDGARAVGDVLELDVTTSEGSHAVVKARLDSDRSVEVRIEPADTASVTALGERFESPLDERIYGLTERLRDSPPLSNVIEIPLDDIAPKEVGSLDRRGEKIEMLVRPTTALYTPFFHSSRGYGLYVEGTAVGSFDIAGTEARALAFRFEAGTSDASRRLVFHVIAGPEHARILDEYTALTGRPFVPPDWAFRHWRWRGELPAGRTAELDGVTVQEQVAEDVHMYDALGIPPGVYLFDRPVLRGNYGFARFEWDDAIVPNVDETLAALRRRGYRVTLWSGAWMCGSEEGDNGLEAQRLGFLAPGSTGTPKCADVGGGSFILDVTSAAARAWFRDRVAEFIGRYRIDGIKLDRGEEHIPTAASDVWADGRNGREVRNDYPNLQAQLHSEALSAVRPGGDFVLISRAGYAGAQKQTVVWGGDIPGSELFGAGAGTDLGLRAAIIAQLRAAFMGFPIWGSDTGGYYQFKDRDVFARWIEFSAFSGIMEIGGTGGPHAPWDMPTEPAYDDEMIAIYRRYTLLRETLLPYIVAAAREAGISGLPLARPLVFAYGDDPAVADLWDEYLFGPDLLVAPVWRIGERSRQVYLPRGEWRSYWDDGPTITGPTTLTVDAPLDSIPVYVRAGATVPR